MIHGMDHGPFNSQVHHTYKQIFGVETPVKYSLVKTDDKIHRACWSRNTIRVSVLTWLQWRPLQMWCQQVTGQNGSKWHTVFVWETLWDRYHRYATHSVWDMWAARAWGCFSRGREPSIEVMIMLFKRLTEFRNIDQRTKYLGPTIKSRLVVLRSFDEMWKPHVLWWKTVGWKCLALTCFLWWLPPGFLGSDASLRRDASLPTLSCEFYDWNRTRRGFPQSI